MHLPRPARLNKAIQREHYPLPTIEDVATRLLGAKVFSVLDVRKGFWHVELDEPSSYLTTFNTPFGWYRWRRMPFGICSAPEVFQRRMHQLIEGPHGAEVVADDFVVVGFGMTVAEAVIDHDKNLDAFLKRGTARGIKLNAEKVSLRMREDHLLGMWQQTGVFVLIPRKYRPYARCPLLLILLADSGCWA